MAGPRDPFSFLWCRMLMLSSRTCNLARSTASISMPSTEEWRANLWLGRNLQVGDIHAVHLTKDYTYHLDQLLTTFLSQSLMSLPTCGSLISLMTALWSSGLYPELKSLVIASSSVREAPAPNSWGFPAVTLNTSSPIFSPTQST